MLQGGSLWAGLISGGVQQLQDTNSLTKGTMERKEYVAQTAQNVTGAFGVMAGVEYGAMLGTTVFPGVGTAIGAVVGGFLGNRVGRAVGNQAGQALVNSPIISSVPGLKQENQIQ